MADLNDEVDAHPVDDEVKSIKEVVVADVKVFVGYWIKCKYMRYWLFFCYDEYMFNIDGSILKWRTCNFSLICFLCLSFWTYFRSRFFLSGTHSNKPITNNLKDHTCNKMPDCHWLKVPQRIADLFFNKCFNWFNKTHSCIFPIGKCRKCIFYLQVRYTTAKVYLKCIVLF